MPFPESVRSQLVSFDNPKGDINNSDLELAGSLVHHAAVADTYDVRERTLDLSKLRQQYANSVLAA